MRFVALILIGLLTAASAATPDHLEPERSILGGDLRRAEYHTMVVTALAKAYENTQVLARVVVLPPFSPEYAVGISKERGDYKIFRLSPEKHLWLYELLRLYESGSVTVEENGKDATAEHIRKLRAELPPSYRNVKLNECEIAIDTDLGERIRKLWKEVLFQTRYYDDSPKDCPLNATCITFTTDATHYHFSMPFKMRDLSGETKSPDDASSPGKLVAISDLMAKACMSSDQSLLPEIGRQVRLLSARIRRSAR